MMNWKREKPLFGDEGLIKDLLGAQFIISHAFLRIFPSTLKIARLSLHPF